MVYKYEKTTIDRREDSHRQMVVKRRALVDKIESQFDSLILRQQDIVNALAYNSDKTLPGRFSNPEMDSLLFHANTQDLEAERNAQLYVADLQRLWDTQLAKEYYGILQRTLNKSMALFRAILDERRFALSHSKADSTPAVRADTMLAHANNISVRDEIQAFKRKMESRIDD